jgi:hypothetical protein
MEVSQIYATGSLGNRSCEDANDHNLSAKLETSETVQYWFVSGHISATKHSAISEFILPWSQKRLIK